MSDPVSSIGLANAYNDALDDIQRLETTVANQRLQLDEKAREIDQLRSDLDAAGIANLDLTNALDRALNPETARW